MQLKSVLGLVTKGPFRECDKELIDRPEGVDKGCGSHMQPSIILKTWMLSRSVTYLFPFPFVDMATTCCGMLGIRYIGSTFSALDNSTTCLKLCGHMIVIPQQIL